MLDAVDHLGEVGLDVGVLQGCSGPMNSIRLTYRYEDLKAYEDHEAGTLRDVGKRLQVLSKADSTSV